MSRDQIICSRRCHSFPLPGITPRNRFCINIRSFPHTLSFSGLPAKSPCKMFRFLPARSIQLTRSLATHAAPIKSSTPVTRHNWKKEEIQEIYNTPLLDLVYRAASVHRQHHDPSKIQLCTLMNIKSMLLLLYPGFLPLTEVQTL